MPTSATNTPGSVTSFVCDCDERIRPACSSEAFYKEYEGKRYCVLHYPGKEKRDAFNDVVKRKLDAGDFDFRGVWFHDKANFIEFHFKSEAEFESGVDFSQSIFESYVRFVGRHQHLVFEPDSFMNLEYIRIEKPELLSFHRLRLQPNWFVNVDARKFEFISIYWDHNMKRDIQGLNRPQDDAHSMLSVTYRQLAVNSEELSCRVATP